MTPDIRSPMRLRVASSVRVRLLLVASFACAACGGSSASTGLTGPAQSEAGPGQDVDGGGGTNDGGPSGSDGGPTPTPDASTDTGPGTSTDGTPQRLSCTSTFGSALSTAHGRIDGRLVALVPTNQHSCNSDTTHLHLQIAMSGSTYDVAVNLDALTDEIDTPLPDGAWSEGWHDTMTLDYVSNLGLHAAAFTAGTVDTIQQHLIASLANVNHISVFATGYGPGGAHLVHRQGGGRDGAVFIEPLSAKAHGFVFHFNTQTF